jgi:gas vesicle protein
MNIKSLVIGIVIGAVLATAVMFTFGDQILGHVGDTTEEIGKTVKKAGQTIEQQGDKLR